MEPITTSELLLQRIADTLDRVDAKLGQEPGPAPQPVAAPKPPAKKKAPAKGKQPEALDGL